MTSNSNCSLAVSTPTSVIEAIGSSLEVDEADVIEVVGLVVVVVDAQPLGRVVVVGRAQGLGHVGIVDDAADLVVQEPSHRVVCLGTDADVVERRQAGQLPALPHALVRREPLLVGHVERGDRRLIARHAHGGVPRQLAIRRAIAQVFVHPFLGDRAVVGRNREVRGALEDGELSCLLGDDRNRLDRRRPGTDDRHPLPGEVDLVVRPTTGEVGLAGKPFGPGHVGHLGYRQASGRHHVEPCRHVVAHIGVHCPPLRRVVPRGRGDPGLEPDVAPQVVLVGNEVGVAQDLGLGCVALRPGPLAFEFGVPAVGVVDGEDVAPGARIPIPVPGAAHSVAGFDHHGAEPGCPHAMQLVHPGEAGPDDERLSSTSRSTLVVLSLILDPLRSARRIVALHARLARFGRVRAGPATTRRPVSRGVRPSTTGTDRRRCLRR